MSKKMTKRQRNTVRVPTHNEYMAQTRMSLQPINPLTEAQAKMRDSYYDDSVSCLAALGSAGTGKSYMALALALEDVITEKNFDRVVIIRSAVQVRSQGFLPGDLEEKMSYYEGPYADIVSDLTGKKDAYKQLKERGKIEFLSSSFIRGLTFDNAIVIVDEAQSMNSHELKSIITRIGDNSKILICGDTKQDDLSISRNSMDKSGLVEVMKILERVQSFDIIRFKTDDIVRSGFVREFLIAEEELGAA